MVFSGFVGNIICGFSGCGFIGCGFIGVGFGFIGFIGVGCVGWVIITGCGVGCVVICCCWFLFLVCYHSL